MKRMAFSGSTSLLLAECIPVIPLSISIVTSGLSGLSLLADWQKHDGSCHFGGCSAGLRVASNGVR